MSARSGLEEDAHNNERYMKEIDEAVWLAEDYQEVREASLTGTHFEPIIIPKKRSLIWKFFNWFWEWKK